MAINLTYLLMEDGNYLLQEDGFKIILTNQCQGSWQLRRFDLKVRKEQTS